MRFAILLVFWARDECMAANRGVFRPFEGQGRASQADKLAINLGRA